MNQKPKRSTSKPRAGTKRTKRTLRQAAADAAADHAAHTAEMSAILNKMPWAPGHEPTSESREPNRDRAHRWSITYPSRQSLFKDAPSERRPASLEEFHPAALEQFEEARQVAMRILDSGVVGDGECVTIISGQGNTDHKPTNGQPNDGLAIVIRQVGS